MKLGCAACAPDTRIARPFKIKVVFTTIMIEISIMFEGTETYSIIREQRLTL